MKVFTIDEIRNYLEKQSDLETALTDLSEQNIIDAIPVTDINSLNYKKTDQNLKRYEDHIGMTKVKEYQRTLYRNTNGEQGRYWMALSPRWTDSKETTYKIGYWVNYGDDETYGFFYVEQILEWFNNPSIKLYQLGGTRERIR